jgi:hypothetical protein
VLPQRHSPEKVLIVLKSGQTVIASPAHRFVSSCDTFGCEFVVYRHHAGIGDLLEMKSEALMMENENLQVDHI